MPLIWGKKRENISFQPALAHNTTQANGGDTVNKTDNNHNKKNDEHRSPANGDGKMITITLSTEKFTARVGTHPACRVLMLDAGGVGLLHEPFVFVPLTERKF